MSSDAYFPQTKPPATSSYQPSWQLGFLWASATTGAFAPRRMYPMRLTPSRAGSRLVLPSGSGHFMSLMIGVCMKSAARYGPSYPASLMPSLTDNAPTLEKPASCTPLEGGAVLSDAASVAAPFGGDCVTGLGSRCAHPADATTVARTPSTHTWRERHNKDGLSDCLGSTPRGGCRSSSRRFFLAARRKLTRPALRGPCRASDGAGRA